MAAIDLQTASVEDLVALCGIGETRTVLIMAKWKKRGGKLDRMVLAEIAELPVMVIELFVQNSHVTLGPKEDDTDEPTIGDLQCQMHFMMSKMCHMSEQILTLTEQLQLQTI